MSNIPQTRQSFDALDFRDKRKIKQDLLSSIFESITSTLSPETLPSFSPILHHGELEVLNKDRSTKSDATVICQLLLKIHNSWQRDPTWWQILEQVLEEQGYNNLREALNPWERAGRGPNAAIHSVSPPDSQPTVYAQGGAGQSYLLQASPSLENHAEESENQPPSFSIEDNEKQPVSNIQGSDVVMENKAQNTSSRNVPLRTLNLNTSNYHQANDRMHPRDTGFEQPLASLVDDLETDNPCELADTPPPSESPGRHGPIKEADENLTSDRRTDSVLEQDGDPCVSTSPSVPRRQQAPVQVNMYITHPSNVLVGENHINAAANSATDRPTSSAEQPNVRRQDHETIPKSDNQESSDRRNDPQLGSEDLPSTTSSNSLRPMPWDDQAQETNLKQIDDPCPHPPQTTSASNISEHGDDLETDCEQAVAAQVPHPDETNETKDDGHKTEENPGAFSRLMNWAVEIKDSLLSLE